MDSSLRESELAKAAADKRKRDAESDEGDSGDDGEGLSDEGEAGPAGSSKPLTKADKRAHHNALERKRRDHIKDSFSTLRDAVPSLQGEKASRAQILNKATDYIQYMKKRNSSHLQEMEDLKRQNSSLQLQVNQL
eukprot:m.57117 g.57117  ORF g.57117 m.57117 type:complete len:135 (-) comp12086_c0_seq4:1737-2141(-)